MKKIIALIIIGIFSSNGWAEPEKPNHGKMAVEAMVTGITGAFKKMPEVMGIMTNKLKNELKEPEEAKTWTKTVKCNGQGKECKTTYSD